MAKKGAKKRPIPWAKKDVSALKKSYSSTSNKEIASKLGRTEKAIEQEASRLGLKKSKTYMKKLRSGKK